MTWPVHLDALLDELIQIKLAQFAQSQFSTPIEGPKVAPSHSALAPFQGARPIVKRAFQVSQFSGPLSYGGFKQVSPGPGFTMNAPLQKAAPSAPLAADPGSSMPVVKQAAEGMGDNIPTVSSPKAVLSRTQQVGGAQSTPQPGPSISSQVSPANVGKGSPVGPPIPGAMKT